MFKFIKKLLLAPIALILVFEEWGWTPLQKLVAKLRSLIIWRILEDKIVNLSPYSSLFVMLVPGVFLFPIKLGALYLIGTGHSSLGLLLIIAAKIVGTAIVARLFTITLPKLMQITWFAKYYPKVKAWKDNIIEKVHNSFAWRFSRMLKNKLKMQSKIYFKKMFS